MKSGKDHILGKIIIKGKVKCLTGLHIGASKENMEIGGLDLPVIRDPITHYPYIPGSSLKGKLRALLEKATLEALPNRDGGSGINRHECNDWEKGKNPNKNYSGMEFDYPGAQNCPICRLFGSTGPGENNRNFPARLKVRDLSLKNADELEKIDSGLYLTEWKFENGIDRITSAANPRNIERVPRGAKFRLNMVYDVEDADMVKEDMANLTLAMQLLEDDALGGHGSRGYGQVKLEITSIEVRKIGFYKGTANQALQVEMKDIDQVANFLRTSHENLFVSP
jgi:CRISPR-associated protein Csm3